MGRRIWVAVPSSERQTDNGHTFRVPEHLYDVRVLSFKQFLAADPPTRPKHLVQLWTDPGGMRTLSVGSIRLKDPKRSAAARLRHAKAAEES